MNDRTLKALERELDRLERRNRRSGRRITASSLALVAGLFLGDFLLASLIPHVWPTLLGSDPGLSLRGWPLVVWRVSQLCLAHQPGIVAGLVAFSLVALGLTYRVRLVRPLVWLAALGVVFLDAGILASTMLACLQAAGVSL